jgi:hypothetical protein
MMKIMKISVILLMFVTCASTAALAGTVVPGNWIYLTSWNPVDDAGIMNLKISQDSTHTGTLSSLSTFCIQDNTLIYPSTWYLIKDISNQVGPYNPNHAGEGPLNGAVDYLFYQYSTGKYDAAFSGSNNNQADFQRILWSLQQTGPNYTPIAGTLWANDLAYYSSNSQLQSHSWGTKVLNIVDSNGNDIQNQLYHVPEPATILLLGIAFGAIALSKRMM